LLSESERVRTIILGWLLLCLATTPGLALAADGGQTLYVSPAGDDAAAGTPTQPWRTLGRAAAAAPPGDTVLLAPGVYRETLRPGRSGTADRPIVYAAVEHGTAVIDGADVLTGWTQVQPGVFRGPIDGAPNLVFEADRPLARKSSPRELTGAAWSFEGGALFVRTSDGASPDQKGVTVSRRPAAVLNGTSHIELRGLKLVHGDPVVVDVYDADHVSIRDSVLGGALVHGVQLTVAATTDWSLAAISRTTR
jgi:hypothetical protein